MVGAAILKTPKTPPKLILSTPPLCYSLTVGAAILKTPKRTPKTPPKLILPAPPPALLLTDGGSGDPEDPKKDPEDPPHFATH